MNIIFDISVLGAGNSFACSRTGVFRVVEHLAIGLNADASSNTTFCTSNSNYNHCRNYLLSNTLLQESVLSEPHDLLSSIYNRAESLRFEVAKLPQQIWKTPLRKIYRFGKKFVHPIDLKDIVKSDIFHSPAHPIPEQIIASNNLIKFITIHDLIPFVCPEYCHPSSADYMRIILDSIKADTFVTCVSEATRQDLLSFMPFLDPEKVSVVHLAAGSHFYRCNSVSQLNHVKRKYNIPIEGEYLLALSTLQPRKNFERIINSYVELVKAEHIKELSLVLVGADGWDFDRIYKEINGAGEFAAKIIVTGYVPDEDLAPLYSGALAFLYPSLYEGFGLPPLEAMQCGTPVITSNNSSLPEVVGNAAIMIDPKDGEALCQEMLNLYNNSELRKQLSAVSMERAKLFNWDKMTKETVAAYKNALFYK